MNKFCFGAIYNGRLWEKELRVSAQHKCAIGTQEFPNSKYNVLKQLLLLYKIGVCPLCFNALSDHHRFSFSKCDIIKDSVACYVVVIALFSLEKIALNQLASRTN